MSFTAGRAIRERWRGRIRLNRPSKTKRRGRLDHRKTEARGGWTSRRWHAKLRKLPAPARGFRPSQQESGPRWPLGIKKVAGLRADRSKCWKGAGACLRARASPSGPRALVLDDRAVAPRGGRPSFSQGRAGTARPRRLRRRTLLTGVLLSRRRGSGAQEHRAHVARRAGDSFLRRSMRCNARR